MNEMNIARLTTKFRQAIDRAQKANEFEPRSIFFRFPRGCCGDTAYLLAEFLLEHGIRTLYVSGRKDDWTHAWLVEETEELRQMLDEEQERRDQWKRLFQKNEDCADTYATLLQLISDGTLQNFWAEEIDYSKALSGHVIMDITGDQFKEDEEFLNYDRQVYVGEMDAFHQLFEIDGISECEGLNGINKFNIDRMQKLYSTIVRYVR